MPIFIDLRQIPSGGSVASHPRILVDGQVLIGDAEFASRVQGFHLVLATHGFNVDAAAGISHLSLWSRNVQLPGPTLFIGVLWPGDSRFVPFIDYPIEGNEAIAAGRLLASYLDTWAKAAQSLSFVSHSLGGRMILETIQNLQRDVRTVVLMAAAIENDCLAREYRDAASRIQEIFVYASSEDWVLKLAYPPGDLVGQIFMHGHPYYKVALGRAGPEPPIPSAQMGGTWFIPKTWDYGHLDYLPGQSMAPMMSVPVPTPTPSSPPAGTDRQPPWKPAWSAAAVSTAMR